MLNRVYRKTPAGGFSLVELLVVMAIIIILVAFLLPSLGNLQDRAKRIQCLNQLRQIGIAFLAFAVDHDGHLPASTPARKRVGADGSLAMLGKEIMPALGTAPFTPQLEMGSRFGGLIEYLGGHEMVRKLYRCPSHPYIEIHSQVGSNGLFDYCMSGCFNGAKVVKLPRYVVYVHRDTRQIIGKMMTPLIVEESPERLNWHNLETEYQNVDEPGTWHTGGIFNYMTIDGSGHSHTFPSDQPLPRVREFFSWPDFFPIHIHCDYGTWPCLDPRDPNNLSFSP